GGAVGQNPPAGAIIYYTLKTAIKKPEARRGEQPAGGEAAPAGAAATPSRETRAREAGAGSPRAPITLEILDSKGQVIRKYPAKRQPGEEAPGEDEGFGRPQERPLPTEAGLNRFVWDLRYEGSTRVPRSPLWAGNTDGPVALPGTYQIKLTVQGK